MSCGLPMRASKLFGEICGGGGGEERFAIIIVSFELFLLFLLKSLRSLLIVLHIYILSSFFLSLCKGCGVVVFQTFG